MLIVLMDVTLTDKSGELMFRFDRVDNAYNYSVQTAASANGPWEDEDLSTSSRVLERFKKIP